jgi:hypothetical protein
MYIQDRLVIGVLKVLYEEQEPFETSELAPSA